jgi:hypothetical protein
VRPACAAPSGCPTYGNRSNYEQLGLKFKLYSAEVLFNKGLAQIYLGKVQEGLADMEEARREKATEEHNVIDDAIQDRGEGYTVFSIVSMLIGEVIVRLTEHPSLSACYTAHRKRR